MKRFSILLATVLAATLLTFGVASAHSTTGIAGTVDCKGDYSITVDGDIWGNVHLIVTLAGTTIYDEAQPGNDTSVRTFGPFTGKGAAVGQEITARAGDSNHVETGTLVSNGDDCSPPPPSRKIAPRGWFNGPCGDPMYRAVYDNRKSDVPVTFSFRFKAYASHSFKTVTSVVGAHRLVKTHYKHVLGGSLMRIRGNGKTLATGRSAPGGNYGGNCMP